MIIKEQEAGGKFCPAETSVTCLGSECMAWREIGTADGPKGYCGMAGIPAAVTAHQMARLGMMVQQILSPQPQPSIVFPGH